jgi:5-methylcytosine-specific restriction endonuclease McrA
MPKYRARRSSTPSNVWSGNTVRSARAHWAQRLPLPCHLCPGMVTPDQAWVVEHMVPRSQGGDPLDRTNQWVSHRSCSDRSGGALRQRFQPTGPTPPAPVHDAPVLDHTNGGQTW